jgi:hypothetical protein
MAAVKQLAYFNPSIVFIYSKSSNLFLETNICGIHKENPTRCNNVSEFLLFYIYMKLNMFRATHCPLSGA